MRFQIPTSAIMKMAVFRFFAPCSLVSVYRRFRGACFLIIRARRQQAPLKVGKLLSDYTAQKRRKQPFSGGEFHSNGMYTGLSVRYS
jgi:hypothetical protein